MCFVLWQNVVSVFLPSQEEVSSRMSDSRKKKGQKDEREKKVKAINVQRLVDTMFVRLAEGTAKNTKIQLFKCKHRRRQRNFMIVYYKQNYKLETYSPLKVLRTHHFSHFIFQPAKLVFAAKHFPSNKKLFEEIHLCVRSNTHCVM